MTEQAGQHDEDPLPIAADEKPDHDAGATALTIEDHRRDSAAGGGL